MMPARWSMEDLRNAVAAAIAAAPARELVFDPAIALTDQEREQFAEALAEVSIGPMRVIHGCKVYEPQLNPALAHPLVLGGISEISDRLEAARSTVVGWTKRAEKIGMPAPIAELAAGPVYDLTAVETWYRAWKADDSGETIGDNGGGG